jgi:4-amino-4-deoxy-L-arabinose transferase-like glycosyltransferase
MFKQKAMLLLSRQSVIAILKDIRFWIILFFALRLYGITNAPLEPASTWRQCDVLMIARNFYEIDSNILYPRVDLAGNSEGIVGVEFPIYNYLIYLLSILFGFEDWYGRIINLVATSFGAFYFYKLISRNFNEEHAFYSTILLLVTGWFSFARVTLPDTFAASICIVSLHFAFNYFEKGKLKDLLLFTLMASVGCLSKISAASILTVLLIPMLNVEVDFSKKIALSLSAGFILSLVCLWYFYWVPHLNTIGYAGHFFMGMPFSDGIRDILNNPAISLKRFYDDPLKYSGFAFFLFSIYIAFKNRNLVPFFTFLIPFLGFVVFILKSGWGYYVNGYYFVMFLPAMTFMCGYGMSIIKNKKLQLAILVIIGIENIANQVHVFQIRDSYVAYIDLENILLQANVGKKDLIAINNPEGHNPTPMFMAHRRGWNLPNDYLSKEENRAYLKENNCKYILVLKKQYGEDVDLPLQELYDSDDFKIYKL